ncbi:MAG: hypothetical protein K2W95_16050 [Candidatus Obscuribacterales bacterium]|nr:hypothetical protein [Candidatus Obscuribacterales bacterium]
MSGINGSNQLDVDLQCPKCGHPVECGIGFRAGAVKGIKYKPGDKISWDGKPTWPSERPIGGNFKTIGYFECENLRCPTWSDCYPEVQEMLVTIEGDVITGYSSVSYKPDKIDFEVFSLEQEV